MTRPKPATKAEHCPYNPINGSRCRNVGTVEIVDHGRGARVCAEHLQRYLSNGWTVRP